MLPRVVALALLATAASAQDVELGARLELLTVDAPLEFSCDQPCDTEGDPDCRYTPTDELCEPATVDEPHDGWLFGFLVGVHGGGDVLHAGVRLAATFGVFEPSGSADGETSSGATADDESLLLGHVTIEAPIEARFGGATHLFVQIVPRLGSLNLLDGRDEEADTFTAGVLAVVGVRLGVEDGRVGAAVERVAHPSFGGWGVEAHYFLGK